VRSKPPTIAPTKPFNRSSISLPPDLCAEIVELFWSTIPRARIYAAGERIVATGEIAPGAFVILAGQVDVIQNGGWDIPSLIIFVSADRWRELDPTLGDEDLSDLGRTGKCPKPAGLRALVSTYRTNDKLAVAGREPSSHLRGRSSRPAGGRRGNDAERAACRIRRWLADFLPNKVITTRITFLACAYRPVGRYAAANGQIHCPGAIAIRILDAVIFGGRPPLRPPRKSDRRMVKSGRMVDTPTMGIVRKTACWIGGVRRRLRPWLRSPSRFRKTASSSKQSWLSWPPKTGQVANREFRP
jgi:hypothetical protein